MIAAGMLDRRVTVQVRTDAQNDPGLETWQKQRDVWAAVLFASPGDETFHASQPAAFQSPTFVLRFDAAYPLSPKGNRLLIDGRVYDITGVAEVEHHSKLLVSTQARAE